MKSTTSFWNFQLCSNKPFYFFYGCNFSCTAFQDVICANTPCLQSHFSLCFVHCRSHLKGEVEVGQKICKTFHPFCNQHFFLALPPIPFWGGGTKPEQYKTTCQMTKSTGNRNSADSHNCTNAQSQSREISPDQKQAEKEPLSDSHSIFADSVFSFRVFRFMIRVSEGGHERAYRMTPHSICIYTYTY